MDYQQFVKSKQHSTGKFGFDPLWYPKTAFDYQKHIIDWSCRKGRAANFVDTGLGKTLIELTLAHNIVLKTNKRVLILTPLAVAFQFIVEAEKFGIPDVYHSKKGELKGKIIVANYERLQYFDPSDFEGLILDESSILKNFKGATRKAITDSIRNIKYRQLATATPSPNDFVELGTSSEALGYLGHTDMLGRFFTNNEDTVSPQNIGTKWLLKGHAREDFFKWVSSWAMSVRKPSDIGFSDEKHKLPKLNLKKNCISNNSELVVQGQFQMFKQIAKTMSEVKSEERQTIRLRCEKAVECANNHETSVYWCNYNKEAAILKELDKNAYEISGSMKLEKKEELLLAFSRGEIKKLITKAKITSFGLNWQHCNHTVFFPTFSYEQYYQAIRRFWRFGQKNEVEVDLVYSDGQKRVIDALEAKTKKANELFSKLNSQINSTFTVKSSTFDKTIKLPSFL